MFLMLGNAGDPCCQRVREALANQGRVARIVEAPLEPPAMLTWRLDANGLVSSLYPDTPDSAIDGVFVRDVGWLDPTEWEPDDFAYMQAELRAVILAWLNGLQCPVINRPDATQWYRAGAPLVAWRRHLRVAGLKLPEVLITSEPAEAIAFRHRHEAAGVVYAPLTNAPAYLLADDDALTRLASMQARIPVCVTQAHGPATLACVVGDEVIWNDPLFPFASELETPLRRFSASASLTFVEIAIAPVRGEPMVILIDPKPRLERYAEPIRARIVAALVAELTRCSVTRKTSRVPS